MSVTVDRQSWDAQNMGLQTVGQVLARIQKEDRLVVQILLDGEEPDPARLCATKKLPLNGHTIYIETADPRQLALEVLGETRQQLVEAERAKSEAADLLQRNQSPKAMEKLSGCFATWQNAQDAMTKTAALLRIDPGSIVVEGRPVVEMLAGFSETLRQIRGALEQRDFVLLSDILLYETADTTARWNQAIEAMEGMVRAIGR